MKRVWDQDELIEHFTFLPNEMQEVGKKTGENRLGFAILFKFFQYEARFPANKSEVPEAVIEYIARGVGGRAGLFSQYDWDGRAMTYHRAQIREFFGFRENIAQDAEDMAGWLCKGILLSDHNIEHLTKAAYQRFRDLKIVPPTPGRVGRLINAAISQFEDQFFQATLEKLPPESLPKMDSLVSSVEFFDEGDVSKSETEPEERNMTFQDLKADPGKPSVDSALGMVFRLRTIRNLGLPDNLFNGVPLKILYKYRLRAATEDIRELRRHPEPIRYTLLAAFIYLRSMEITDGLIELLIQIIHGIGTRAERKVNKEILNEIRKVNNKNGILLDLAESAVNNPDGVVKDVIFPAVNEQTLRDIIKELNSTGPAYRKKIHSVMRASYGNHYRRMIPEVLGILDFRSNNEIHKPVIRALDVVRKYADTAQRYLPLSEDIPVDGVVPAAYKEIVVEIDEKGKERINRMNYEICVF